MATKVKLSDYIVDYLVKQGVQDTFMITGGGALHLNESFGSHPGMRYWCNHHEQAATMAAEGYTRLTNRLCVVQVTTGPGSTNTLTGVAGAWLDSIPLLVLSGQVKRDDLIGDSGLRQLGLQELPIVKIVEPMTKYAAIVLDENKIRYHLEKALYLATHGRPGPVWLDIPLDVQAARIDPSQLETFDSAEIVVDLDALADVKKQVSQVVQLLQEKERPVILAGNGIRLGNAVENFHQLIDKLNAPILTAVTAHDLIPSAHPLFFGRPALFGERVGNFVVQNCDLLISIGTRLSIWTISYAYVAFAREAIHVMVDIDRTELRKKTVHPEILICTDAKVFIQELIQQLGDKRIVSKEKWLNYCRRLREKYPPVLPEMRQQTKYVNSYHFIDVLSDCLSEEETIVIGDGTAFTCTYQCIRLKENQRLIGNVGCASMGYGLPAAIGACIGKGKKRVICITGDGSIQMNLQELQTVVHHQLPLKIFLINNDGYLAIRNTQDNYFGGHYVGSNPASGVSFPDMQKIAKAYGISSNRINSHQELKDKIEFALQSKGPFLCEIMMDPRQALLPKVTSYVRPDGKIISKPMEDMYPFLPREEFSANMLVKPIQED